MKHTGVTKLIFSIKISGFTNILISICQNFLKKLITQKLLGIDIEHGTAILFGFKNLKIYRVFY